MAKLKKINKEMILNYCKYVKIQCKKYSHIPLQPFKITYFWYVAPVFPIFWKKRIFKIPMLGFSKYKKSIS